MALTYCYWVVNVYFYRTLALKPTCMSSERNYIQLCRHEIEKLLVLTGEDGSLKLRDFEYLSGLIKEKSGVTLSVSTLKRLWKDSYSQIPQTATLNALVSILGCKDWQEFRQKHSFPDKKPKIKKSFKRMQIASVLVIFLLFAGMFLMYKTKDPVIRGKIIFTADKTVSLGVPNTVIFKYDVGNVAADSFFVQQSWNDRNKQRIDPAEHVISSVYYIPGFHRAKLIANDKVIAKQNVHILSDGWMPYISYDVQDIVPTYFKFQDHLKGGIFNIEKAALIKQGLDINRKFILRLNNSRDFGVKDDNFSVNTSFKCDSIKTEACPQMQLMLVFEANIFWVSLVKKGCEYYASYKIGEVYADGNKNDLSRLGCNVYNWQKLSIDVRNREANVKLNGIKVISLQYKEDFGELVGIIYTFKGLGSVDFIRISGADGKTFYKDDFNGS